MHYNIKNILITNDFGNKDDYKNIYINLYSAIKKAILNKSIHEDTQLPPSRVLAKDLNISRSTVLKAYNLLVLEKYVISIGGSGYYVNSSKNKKIHTNLNMEIKLGSYPKISKRGRSFEKNIHIINYKPTEGIAFRPGLPPLDIFPVQQWKNLSNKYWRTIKSSELSYSNTIGLDCLRENISNYLKLYRNISCDANQIIITSGSLHSLYLISNTLIDKNDAVIIENPTYPNAYSLFKSLKANIHPIDIDNEGISVKTIKCEKPKFVYTTPSNQYPSGVKMSMKRRLELLEWASNKSAYIIEDDYNHEFSNWENPITSVFSLDQQKRTIYLGTFNKLLHPSIRLGYMIVPHHLVNVVKALYEQSSRFVSTSLQKTLSDFIEKDYLNKHLRHVIEISVERKQLFLDYFNQNFNNEILLDSNNTGLHLIGKLKNSKRDVEISNYLSQHGIIAHPLSNYYIGNTYKNGLVMGYCSVNNKLIKENITKMAKVYGRFLIS